ncbi:MAG: restriction endonuclease subunit S, partial [Bacteroidetes bacterium]|nr:restriction endonuclease subunit S [Bacteroidota bacterium]
GEWKEVAIEEICTVQRGGSPRPIHDFLAPHGTPWIKISDATNGNARFIDATEEFIRPEGESKSRVVEPGAFILSNSATPGLPRFVRIRACIHDGWLLLSDFRDVDEWFLHYKLKDERELILLKGNGSIFTNLKTTILKEHRIALPPLPEQRAIASVLSSLDAKIDLLHRQNKTLEAMAEALFRQWFVEEAEEGWEQRPLSSIAIYLNGVACQKYPAKDPANRLPVLKIKELSTGITDSSDWATSEIDPKYHVVAGDVVFSWSATLMVKLWDGPKAVLNQHLFKVTSEEFPKWFYFMWTKHHVDEFVAIAESHATTFGHIKRGDLDEAMVLVPGPERLKEMTAVMDPLFEKHITNSAQIKSLTALRDILLPKLMSGEVRVDEK